MPKMLNASELKHLIVNEVKKLHELGSDKGAIAAQINDPIVQFVDQVRDDWIASIEGDPGAEEVGHVNHLDQWTEEVDKAVDELDERLRVMLDEITDKLFNGEYYQGNDLNGHAANMFADE